MTIYFHDRAGDTYERREEGVGELLRLVNSSLTPEQGLQAFFSVARKHHKKLREVSRVLDAYPEYREGRNLRALYQQAESVIALIEKQIRSQPEGVELVALRAYLEEQYGVAYLHGGALEAHLGVAAYIIREAFYLISDWMDRYGYHYRLSTASLQNAPKPTRDKRPERKHHARQVGRR